jgi:uncharacterized protein YjbI with pentapeptide repeats/DNA-binding XRE family transcriptional regulator
VSGINPSSESTDKPLAKLVKIIRSVNELTQASLGKLFDPPVTQSTIARWENGEQMPDKVHFPKIAYFIDLTLEDLERLVQNPQTNLTNWEIKKKALSPNKKHLKVFRRGITAWNKWRNNNPDVIPELTGIELNTEDLDGINLSKADLRGVKFENVTLNSSVFENANLEGADLKFVSFLSANLSNANFSNANLKYVKFNSSQLIKSSFYKTTLSHISFVFANLNDTNFSNAKIIKSNFNETICNRAVFDNAFICNCSVYGASFWECSFKKTESENISISKSKIKNESNKLFEIDSIEFAQSIFLQRNNYNMFKNNIISKFHHEEEIISISNILVETYSSFRYDNKTYNFSYNLDSNKNKSSYENITITKREGDLLVGFRYSDFDVNPEPYSTYKNVIKFILDIKNNIIRSDFELDDIELLENVLKVTKEIQIKRVNELVTIALKILEIQKKSEFIHECYFLRKENGEIVLCSNSECKIELMRVNIIGNQKKILRSNLSERCLTDFQKILLDLLI